MQSFVLPSLPFPSKTLTHPVWDDLVHVLVDEPNNLGTAVFFEVGGASPPSLPAELQLELLRMCVTKVTVMCRNSNEGHLGICMCALGVVWVSSTISLVLVVLRSRWLESPINFLYLSSSALLVQPTVAESSELLYMAEL